MTTLTHTLLDGSNQPRVGVVVTLAVYNGNIYTDTPRWSAAATSGAGGALTWTIPDTIHFNPKGTYFRLSGAGITPDPVMLIKPGTTSTTVAAVLIGSADAKGKLPDRSATVDMATQAELDLRTGSRGLSVQNGTGAKTAFTMAHGLAAAPSYVQASAGSAAAATPFYVTADATNVIVTYLTAPVSGTNNVALNWRATL